MGLSLQPGSFPFPAPVRPPQRCVLMFVQAPLTPTPTPLFLQAAAAARARSPAPSRNEGWMGRGVPRIWTAGVRRRRRRSAVNG